jgi:Flp pilus assembly protein TadG
MWLPSSGKFLSVFRAFSKDNSGNIALIFAAALIPLIGCTGLAIDLARRAIVQLELQAAIDAAALVYVKNGDADGAEKFARSLFAANGSSLSRSFLKSLNFQFKTVGNAMSGTATFTADIDTTFMKVLGVNKMHAEGFATAVRSLRSKIDFHILADSSDSMGLASDKAQQSSLMFYTSQAYAAGKLVHSHSNCAFACHKNQGSKTTTLAVARSNKVDLRVDVARRGINKLITRSSNSDRIDSRYAIYTFNSDLYELQSMTADLAVASLQAGLLEVGFGTTAAQDANTSFEAITSKFVGHVDNHISKLGPKDRPDQIVVLVSDGLKSQNCAACAGRQNVYPFKLEQCEMIKGTGAKLAVIYTEYLQMPLDATYQAHASHAVPLIEGALKSCATPGLFAKGNTPSEIDAAFDVIFDLVSQDLHISQ